MHIPNLPTLIILTPPHSSCMSSINYAHLSAECVNSSIDCGNTFVDRANKSNDCPNTHDDWANTFVDSTNNPDRSSSYLYITNPSLL
jgi:hypothetical protein